MTPQAPLGSSTSATSQSLTLNSKSTWHWHRFNFLNHFYAQGHLQRIQKSVQGSGPFHSYHVEKFLGRSSEIASFERCAARRLSSAHWSILTSSGLPSHFSPKLLNYISISWVLLFSCALVFPPGCGSIGCFQFCYPSQLWLWWRPPWHLSISPQLSPYLSPLLASWPGQRILLPTSCAPNYLLGCLLTLN